MPLYGPLHLICRIRTFSWCIASARAVTSVRFDSIFASLSLGANGFSPRPSSRVALIYSSTILSIY